MAALATVGGSFLAAFLQVLFDRIASRELLDFFKGRKLNHSLLNKLNATLISVAAVLEDAEEKHTTKPPVKLWLDELKDAVYEADDLLDEIAYEALHFELEAGERYQVRNFFFSLNPFTKSVETKLNYVLERIEYLVQQKNLLGLKEVVGEKPLAFKVPTTSLVDENDVFGREVDREKIVELVLSNDANENDPTVIPIVGMAGVGKTTLAQVVYNERGVVEWFDLRVWVCVSGKFDVFKITKDILEEVSDAVCDRKTPNQVQVELRGRLMGKRFLIVLDDVWTDEYTFWEILQRPLKSGAKGSKIIVTTRNNYESISSVMCTFPPYHLKELNDDHCWWLFVKHAFDDRNCSAHQKLELIGREIVRKCKGLPLAAKALGVLLHGKRDVYKWENILKSNLWGLANDNILPALRLSYHFLPSHLKRCFAYCAAFPEDYEFKEEELILLWMAEGLLVQHKGNRRLEEVGSEYFHDLVSRSFFQRSNVNPSCFVMHDLMNELAKLVAGEFCSILKGSKANKIPKKTRHLSDARRQSDVTNTCENISEAKQLRSFLALESSSHLSNEIKCGLLQSLSCLRVLSLPHCDLVELPDSIGVLKHLRYLNLTASLIKRLPEVVGNLYNLQTLILYQCKYLIELPDSMRKLINLYHVDIRETNLQWMPTQMGKLTKLHKLTDFILGKQRGSGIKELGKLQHLREELHIWNLQNVMDAQDSMEADLKEKKQLKKLEFRWEGDTGDSLHERSVLEQLRPHWNVEYLLIVGYGGTRFPDWTGDSRFSNMVSLTLSGCRYCSSLPQLGQLSSLRDLSIIAFPGITAVSLDFYGISTSTKKAFGSLKILRFEKMLEWHVWDSELSQEFEAFPLLQELYLKNCPNLSRALPSHLPSLTKLNVEGCQQLVVSISVTPTIAKVDVIDDSRNVLMEKLPSGVHRLIVAGSSPLDSLVDGMWLKSGASNTFAEIEMIGCELLKCFPLKLFLNLETLRISRCPNFQSFLLGTNSLTCLSSLEIRECPRFVAFPETGLRASNLKQLFIWDCSNLKCLPGSMRSLLPSLVSLEIGNCPEVESFSDGGLPSRLESLHVESCNKLIADCLQWDLRELLFLSRLRIGGLDNVESFPGKMMFPSTLTHVGIWNLQNLICLNYDGIQHLTSLKELVLWNCPKLQSLPNEGLPSSLASLCIWKCPLLKQRCEREKGEDWAKISHIPFLEIDSVISSDRKKTKQVAFLPPLKCIDPSD